MFEKELEKIHTPIIQLFKNKLSDNFFNKSGGKIRRVENVFVSEIEIDEDKSNFKGVVIITKVIVSSKIWEDFHEGFKVDNIILSLDKEIIMNYIDDQDIYIIQNSEELNIIDRTM